MRGSPSLREASACVTVVMLAACATQRAPDQASRSTEISYRTEHPLAEGRHALESGQSVAAPAVPLPGNPLPVYPEPFVARDLPPIEVSALVTVDADGAVAGVEIVPLEPGAACADCDDVFGDSVGQALQHWRFQPLQIVDWVDGPDTDGDGEADSVRRGVVETRPYSLRLRFRFEVHGGRATVSATSG